MRVVAPSLIPGVVDVKIDGALGQAENHSNFGGRLAPRGPGQRFTLTIGHVDELRPLLVASDAGKARTDDGLKQIKIDRLGNKIIGAKVASLELDVAVGERGQKNERQ